VNLHLFQDNIKPWLPLLGFPLGYVKEFHTLASNQTTKKPLPKKCQDIINENGEVLRISLRHVVYKLGSDGGMERVLEPFPDYQNILICKEDIILCDGKADALVLFDQEFNGFGVAPISSEIYETMKVHLFGFSRMFEHDQFIVPGEVTSVKRNSILISNLSIQGLSGGAVVCDINGGVIAYCGGATEKEKTPFGAYVFPIAHICTLVEREDSKKSSSDEDADIII